MNLTLCGSFSCGSCQGNNTFVDLRWEKRMWMVDTQIHTGPQNENEWLTWPWFPPGRHGLWSFWQRIRRCQSTGTASRGRRWPLQGSCWCDHLLRRGPAGTVCGSPPCSPLPPGPDASPCCLWRAQYQDVSIRGCCLGMDGQSGDGGCLWMQVSQQDVCYRPTDSSAARMPFPGETIRRAVSWSSLFCASESVGTWCVILPVRQPLDVLLKIYLHWKIDLFVCSLYVKIQQLKKVKVSIIVDHKSDLPIV